MNELVEVNYLMVRGVMEAGGFTEGEARCMILIAAARRAFVDLPIDPPMEPAQGRESFAALAQRMEGLLIERVFRREHPRQWLHQA